MLNKSCYFIKAICCSFVLLTSLTVIGQDINDSPIKKKVAATQTPLQDIVKLEPAANKYYGFTVEDIEAVFPGLVKHTKQTYMFGKNTYRTRVVKTVDMESLIPILVASIKEQQAQIELLRQEVQVLKNKPVASAN